MTTQRERELEHVQLRYGRRLDSVADRQYWRDNYAGQDMGVLWRRIEELEDEVARLTREAEEHLRHCVQEYDPPTECQCHNRRNPPCSFCCP